MVWDHEAAAAVDSADDCADGVRSAVDDSFDEPSRPGKNRIGAIQGIVCISF
jgi:hypothetical protein